jgi:hypothetical protein
MDQSRSNARYEIEYATDDRVVSICLAKASLYRIAGWMQFVVFLLVALMGFIEQFANAGVLAAMFGTATAFSFMAELGRRKSAWIRTLELRIEDLRQAPS